MKRWFWAGLGLAAMAAGAARADDFDARRAKDVVVVVTSHGASGTLKTGDDGKPRIEAQAGRIFFAVNFEDCDDAKAVCDTVMFTGSWDSKSLNADQINRWNRWTLYCPAYLDTDGEPDIWYSIAVSARTDRDDMAADADRWMGCLTDFDSFVQSPDAFLKRSGGDAAPTAPAAPAPPPAHPG